jgi:diguanylate cyclase (GGDEF)-like protein
VFNYNRLKQQYGLSMPVFAIVLTIVLLVGVTTFSLNRAAGEANRVDATRIGLSIANAVSTELSGIESVAEDNAYWDDAAAAVYGTTDPQDFARRIFVNVSAEANPRYDIVLAADADSRMVMGVQRGALTARTPEQLFGPAIADLRGRIDATHEHASGLMATPDGLRLVAVARVRYSDVALEHLSDAAKPVYFYFSRPLSAAALHSIGRNLVVDGVAVTRSPSAPDVALRDVAGRPVAHLTWTPTAPGDVALTRSLPFMALAALAAFAAIGLLLFKSASSVSELNRVAMLDALSDLPNRRALRSAMRRALRNDRSAALAFIDLDGFKGVNDNYGHAVGDQLIRLCADLAVELTPRGGTVARMGGDEFAIFAEGHDAVTNLSQTVERLLTRLRDPFHIGERTIMIGASVGLAMTGDNCSDPAELMRRADIAMYAAKRAGKMRATWFNPALDATQAEHHRIEQKLRRGLDNDEFTVHYQPIVNARDGSISSIEALVRWHASDGEEIGPDVFIPIAEATGLIDRIGIFVLRRACTEAKAWPDIGLSINVSAAQLGNPDFPRLLGDVLFETGFPPERLEIEITETYVVLDPDMAIGVLQRIHALGVRTALDDFGTGYASIGFLRRFAFDTLKIDRSLVADALTDPSARAMLNASISVAQALGMATVAEGVEYEDQAIVLRAIGCDFLQGWHFSRTLDAAAMTVFLTLPETQRPSRQIAGP